MSLIPSEVLTKKSSTKIYYCFLCNIFSCVAFFQLMREATYSLPSILLFSSLKSYPSLFAIPKNTFLTPCTSFFSFAPWAEISSIYFLIFVPFPWNSSGNPSLALIFFNFSSEVILLVKCNSPPLRSYLYLWKY